VQRYEFNGFPVVQEEVFLGFVGREKLRLALGLSHSTYPFFLTLTLSTEQLLSERSPGELAQECTFSHTYATSEPTLIDLSSLMEVSVLELRTEVPLELVVNMIHKMVCFIFPSCSSTTQ
jgi:chloride channel 3/4/5